MILVPIEKAPNLSQPLLKPSCNLSIGFFPEVPLILAALFIALRADVTLLISASVMFAPFAKVTNIPEMASAF